MNIRWDVRALDDLRDIRRYIARHGSPAAADRVREHLHPHRATDRKAIDRRRDQQS